MCCPGLFQDAIWSWWFIQVCICSYFTPVFWFHLSVTAAMVNSSWFGALLLCSCFWRVSEGLLYKPNKFPPAIVHIMFLKVPIQAFAPVDLASSHLLPSCCFWYFLVLPDSWLYLTTLLPWPLDTTPALLVITLGSILDHAPHSFGLTTFLCHTPKFLYCDPSLAPNHVPGVHVLFSSSYSVAYFCVPGSVFPFYTPHSCPSSSILFHVWSCSCHRFCVQLPTGDYSGDHRPGNTLQQRPYLRCGGKGWIPGIP